jgi:hypothetical protein
MVNVYPQRRRSSDTKECLLLEDDGFWGGRYTPLIKVREESHPALGSGQADNPFALYNEGVCGKKLTVIRWTCMIPDHHGPPS